MEKTSQKPRITASKKGLNLRLSPTALAMLGYIGIKTVVIYLLVYLGF